MGSKIIQSFKAPINLCIGYGSGIIPQKTRNKEKLMMDFIFVVDDPLEWHRTNIQQNPSHYSFLKHLGPNCISNIQNIRPSIYYNAFCKIDEDNLIKYGVM